MICAGDVLALGLDGDQLYKDIKAKAGFESIFGDVSTIVSAINQGYDDCEPVVAQIVAELEHIFWYNL